MTAPALPSTAVPVATGRWRRPLPLLSSEWVGLLLGLLALVLWDLGGADLAAVRLFGDAGGFAWRNHWLTAGVLHQGGRWLATGGALLLAVNAIRPLWSGQQRRERWGALLVTALCLIAIPMIKAGSLTSCPWDLAEFGGVARHVSHWRWLVADGGPGRCFPSGHASAAFAFLAVPLLLLRGRPGAARRALIAVVVLGTLYGLAQLARGAHYPSHTLWTGWICWALTLVCRQAIDRVYGQRP